MTISEDSKNISRTFKIKLERPLHERANLFYTKAFENRKWLEFNLFKFILYQRKQVELKV